MSSAQSITDTKCEAKVTFLFPKTASFDNPVNTDDWFRFGPYDALVHLFEHQIDAVNGVWYGVAELGATINIIRRDEMADGIPPHNSDLFHLNGHFEFSDGRLGSVRTLRVMEITGTNGQYLAMTFVGMTTHLAKNS